MGRSAAAQAAPAEAEAEGTARHSASLHPPAQLQVRMTGACRQGAAAAACPRRGAHGGRPQALHVCHRLMDQKLTRCVTTSSASCMAAEHTGCACMESRAAGGQALPAEQREGALVGRRPPQRVRRVRAAGSVHPWARASTLTGSWRLPSASQATLRCASRPTAPRLRLPHSTHLCLLCSTHLRLPHSTHLQHC